jgi:preprotein translocase SecE subunit
VARNRKRAKERRSRRPANNPATRPGVATARPDRDRRDGERVGSEPELTEDDAREAPSPMGHAAPDVELAEAQMAVQRPAPGDAANAEELDAAEEESESAELAHSNEAAPAARGGSAHRLITFLQGSWRELQRVQWPDRRQVVQATGVVIGFVIVAGLYLGLADSVAGKLVNLILK